MDTIAFQGYKKTAVNLVPGTNNLLDLSGLNGPADVEFVAVINAAADISAITVNTTNSFATGTAKPWVFPAPVDGVSIIRVAGLLTPYIWFTAGASGDTILGSVTAFTKDRVPPANPAQVVVPLVA